MHSQARIWDPLIRLFHWLLVAAFATAYIVEDNMLAVHVAAGYTLAGLLVFRLVWGFIGPQHARFSDFSFSPRAVLAYLRDLPRRRAKRYLGHSPAGGAMTFALLLALAATAVTGLATLGAAEHAGPLAGWLGGMTKSQAHAVKEVHEFFANSSLALVFLHIAGVVFSSLVHHENLPLAMLTGRKRV